ncbi:MAG: thiamine pyrophosphate-dependent enzyme [Candidatus Parcubacteria bacterium]|nr:thiamine pyrophosphate-dependent enzyme [Candidatus Parcubacteria bacterium]
MACTCKDPNAETFNLQNFYKNDCPDWRCAQSVTTEEYLNLCGHQLPPLPGIDEEKIAKLCNTVRGLVFSTVDASKSGHPGGSSSKVEQLVTLLCSGAFRFDAKDPKNPGRDRLVWSAGHCSPLAHSLNALVYETLRKCGVVLPDEVKKYAIYSEDLPRFRSFGGPSGHVESHYALQDTSSGSSGHGLSAGLGLAVLHKSCGLPTKAFVIMGDAETEEGMSYEARNIASNLGMSNLIVLLDYNGYGIDGPINEAVSSPIINHWRTLGWNVIEVNGHKIRELAYAYKIAEHGFPNGKPTVIISHTTKGKHYGKLEDTSDSHGTPLAHGEYLEVMKELGFASTPEIGISEVLASYGEDEMKYLKHRLCKAGRKILSKDELCDIMDAALPDKAVSDHTSIRRPDELPPELTFKEGVPKATRFATEAWFEWMMKHTGYFYVGTGDLSKSILTRKAEDVHGIITPENPLGRGIRFGIAEQNMAMMMVTMSQDVLPGGFRPMTAFGSYGVFTSLMANSVRMGLINNAMNPDAKSFFIMLAAHDGPETGEDGPTHHGLFWMSLVMAYPGIKVYKPLDANEAVEMLFYACERDEPVAFSVARPNTPVFERGEKTGVPPAREACNGAYVFKQYANNGKRKLPVAITGGQMVANLLKSLPEIEKEFDVKIIAVTSPELYEEFCKKEPEKAKVILSEEERKIVVTLHNGWPGFLHSFIMSDDQKSRALGITKFLQSGRPDEIYLQAGFDPQGIADKLFERPL